MTRAGDDVIYAGEGNDGFVNRINPATGLLTQQAVGGGAGNDTIFGEAGDDALKGQSGNDRVYGGDGADLVDGGDGNNYLDGGDGDDFSTPKWALTRRMGATVTTGSMSAVATTWLTGTAAMTSSRGKPETTCSTAA